MSLYRLQSNKQHKKIGRLLFVAFIFSCLFVQCSALAQGEVLFVGNASMMQDNHYAMQMNQGEHDCCDTSPSCCHDDQSVPNNLSVEQLSAVLIVTFNGLNELMLADNRSTAPRFLTESPPYGPPIRVSHCCLLI